MRDINAGLVSYIGCSLLGMNMGLLRMSGLDIAACHARDYDYFVVHRIAVPFCLLYS